MRELNFDLQRFNLVTISSRNYFDVRTFSQEYHVYGDYPSNGRYYFDDEDARVVLSNAAYNTIHCGDGNDTIIDGGYHVSLNAGAGNDKIYMPTCDYGTILPGTGNDTIDIDPINNRGDGNVLIYRAGDGNDVISSAGAGFDTLKIYGNYSIDGKVIRVGSGSITFVDGISRSLVIDAIAGHMKYNGPELNLDYFKQAMTEEAETNLEGFLGYCDTSSVMQSILNDGKDSQYLSEVSSEQAQEISDTLKSLYEQAANLQHLKESQISDEVYRANLDEISKTLDSLSNSLGMLDVGLVLVGSESLNPAIAVIVNIANIAVKTEELHISEKKLLEKYPDYGSHTIDYGTPISVWQGAAPFGIEIPISVYEEQFRANDYWAKKIDRENYSDMYDLKDDLELKQRNWTAIITVTGEGLLILGAYAVGVLTAPEMVIFSLGAALYVNGLNAWSKAKYLNETHQDEQNFVITFWEQLFGQKYGTFKNWLKGNGDSSASQNVVEPTSDTSPINNQAELVFSGGEGNDTLLNVEDNYLIDAGDGSDEISNVGDYVTINAGNVNDYLSNDYVANLGDHVEINGGEGDNTIDNAGSDVIINVADGDNYVGNVGDSVTVNAGNGNNYFDNVGSFVKILAGNGENDVENFGSDVTVNTGNNADFIANYGVNTDVNTGNGKDTVYNFYGSNIRINTGKGEDLIYLQSGVDVVIEYATGDGNDLIRGFDSTSTLQIDDGYGTYSTLESGYDILVNADSETITLKNVYATADTIHINDDTLVLENKNIELPDDDDEIEITRDYISVNGGEGNDYICNYGSNVTITGCIGDDSIENYGDNVTFKYSLNDGNDFIVGFNETSTLIISDAGYSSAISGDDIIITVDEDEITLIDAASLSSVNIFSKEKISEEPQSILLNATYFKNHFNGNDESNSDYATINASKLTKKIRVTGNDKANYIVGGLGGGVLLGKDNNDTLQATDGNTTLDGGDGDDSLIGGAGNDTFIYNGGADSISDFDTGDLVSVKTSQDISFKDSTVTSDDDNVTLNFGVDNKLVFEAVDNPKAISLRSGRSLYTLTKQSIALDKSITLTTNHAGGTFSEGDAYNTIDAAAVGKAISIVGNNNGNYIIGSASFANSLTGGTGNDTFTGGDAADVFFYDGGKDIIQNFDENDKLSIDTDAITEGKAGNRKLIFTLDKNDVLTFKADDTVPAQIALESGGYLTKDGVVGDKSLTLFTNARGTIDLTDELYSGANISLVSAENVAKQSVTLVGGSQGGSFTFAANKKRDVFEYGGGAVSISGYEAGKDRINLVDDAISAFSINGGDVLLTLASDDKNVISLKGAKGSDVLIHQSTNKRNSYSKMAFADTGVLYDKAKATSATLWSNAGDYTADGSIKKITLGEGVKGISITANDKVNTIIDASAAGAVSLISGAKNDKFTGSSNADMFVYTGGKDIFQSFGEADSISLDNNLYDAKITSSKKSVRFKFGSKDTLTIKPTKNDTLSGELNINGAARTYGKNSIAEGGSVSLTSEFGGTYKVAGDVNNVDGHLVKKKLTIKGTTSAESLSGGIGKTLFKGGGGNDTLQGGTGEDTFFYARGDKDSVTIADFDFNNDKLKIASGTLAKVSSISGGVQFAMKEGRGTDAPEVGWFNVTTDAKNILIKTNNTYYWFAEGNETLASDDTLTADKGALITSVNKINKSQVSGYSVIDLNYSTNLIKSEVAVQVKDTLKAAT